MLAMAGGLTEASKTALEQAGWRLLTEYPKIGELAFLFQSPTVCMKYFA